MIDYYSIKADDFQKHSKIRFHFVPDYRSLCIAVAQELADLIKRKSLLGQQSKVILPVGPIDLSYVAEYLNQENINCKNLVVYAMDEYLLPDGSPLPITHPLSFRSFFHHKFMSKLIPANRIPEDQIILPIPNELQHISELIEESGVDITFGGLGIDGHFAFNSPLDEPIDLETFRNTRTRIVTLRESDVAQFAITGSQGNLEIIPKKACTLGMKELLSAEKIFLTFMRSWHAGALRRALFGPITPNYPGSLIQLHPNVVATITPEAACNLSNDLLMGMKI